MAVDTNVVAGTYENEITYTALASAKSLDQVSTNLVRDLAFGGKNDTQTLRFDLNDSAASVTEDMLTVALVPHSVLATNNYTITGLDMNDYAKCPVTDVNFNTTAGYTEIACTTPDHGPELGNGGGTFDYWVNISGYNYNYVSKINYTEPGTSNTSIVGAFVYAGLQTEYAIDDARYSAGTKIVTKMQEMSQGICSNTNMWANTTGNDAQIYDYGGLSPLTTAGADSAALGLGTFKLLDSRDDKPYAVRRLADGNCWMVQNLGLDLADFANTDNLTSANTNLASKAVWDPAKSMFDYAKTLDPTSTQANYFEIASLAKLGTAQTYQFQPHGVLGEEYHWGSKYNESGEVLSTQTSSGCPINKSSSSTNSAFHCSQLGSGEWIENNSRSQMPRSYNNNYDYVSGKDFSGNTFSAGSDSEWTLAHASTYKGVYYNWYAATAESGIFSGGSGNASDSLCPKGWLLPRRASGNSYNNSGNRTWYHLFTAQGMTIVNGSNASAAKAFELPISISTIAGMLSTGNINWADGAHFMAPTKYGVGMVTSLYQTNNSYFPTGASSNIAGANIRCVAQGEPAETPVVATCNYGEICYNGNGGTGDMSSDKHTGVSSGDSVTLKAPSFQKEGFAFAGWSTTDGSTFGETYGPNETITAPDTIGSTGLTLYAKWLAPSGTMQDFDATACSNLGMEQTIALTDTRDGNVYTVAKLKDNNCWMTSNLSLNLADFQNTNKLTSENTDLSLPEIADESTRKGLVVLERDENTGKASKVAWDPGKSTRDKITQYDAELTQLGVGHDFEGLAELLLGQSGQKHQFQSTGETSYIWASKVSDDGNWTALSEVTNNANAEMPRFYDSGSVNGYGGYYNWYAATAESGTYALTSGNASDSLCPAGWQLPVNGGTDTNRSWQHLLYHDANGYGLPENSYSYRITRQLPLSFVESGFYGFTGTIISRTSYADYFSSTPTSSGTTVYGVYSPNFGVIDATNGTFSKPGGFSVRCVQK